MLWKKISTIASIALAGGALFAAFLASSSLPKQDFSAFWSAAHLASQNPYSLPLVTAFERSRGVFTPDAAIVMKNPPRILLFLLLHSAFNYGIAFALWRFIFQCCRTFGVQLHVHGMDGKHVAHHFLCCPDAKIARACGRFQQRIESMIKISA
jgi:hypothetical protein